MNVGIVASSAESTYIHTSPIELQGRGDHIVAVALSGGGVAVAYNVEESSHHDLRIIICDSFLGTKKHSHSIATHINKNAMSNIAMVLLTNEKPMVLFSKERSIMGSRALDVEGQQWELPWVIFTHPRPWVTSLSNMKLIDGNPAIAFSHGGGNLWYIRADDQDGDSWTDYVTTVTYGLGDQYSEHLQEYASLAIVNENPAVLKQQFRQRGTRQVGASYARSPNMTGEGAWGYSNQTAQIKDLNGNDICCSGQTRGWLFWCQQTQYPYILRPSRGLYRGPDAYGFGNWELIQDLEDEGITPCNHACDAVSLLNETQLLYPVVNSHSQLQIRMISITAHDNVKKEVNLPEPITVSGILGSLCAVTMQEDTVLVFARVQDIIHFIRYDASHNSSIISVR